MPGTGLDRMAVSSLQQQLPHTELPPAVAELLQEEGAQGDSSVRGPGPVGMALRGNQWGLLAGQIVAEPVCGVRGAPLPAPGAPPCSPWITGRCHAPGGRSRVPKLSLLLVRPSHFPRGD